MIRVKDPLRSLDFYTNLLGFKLIWHSDYPKWGFSVYFLSPIWTEVPKDKDAAWKHLMSLPGCLEVTWNHGSEKEAADKVYNTGNADTTGVKGETVRGGFGHIGISVDDVYKTCARLKEAGVELKKSPNSGGMKGLAFAYDPDGYLVEILPNTRDKATGGLPTQSLDCNGVSVSGGDYTDNSKK